MVDRSDEPRLTTPIVPDPNDELTSRQRPASAPAARTWPLWLLCLLLAASLAALAGAYWLDRQRWQTIQRDLEGQLSNLHARFDSLDDRYASDDLGERLESLGTTQQDLQAQQEELVSALQSLEDSSADGANLEELIQRFDAAEEERDTLAATLEAMQRSLDIIEQSGEEARAALDSRLEDQATAQDETEQRLQALDATDNALASDVRGLNEANEQVQNRVEALDETYTQLQERVQTLADSATGDDLATLESRLDRLATQLETLQSGSEERQARWEQLASRVESNQTGLTELRQNQLALSASLESLSNRIGQSQGASPQELRELEERMESLETSRRQLTGRVADLLSDVGDMQRRGN